MTSVGRSRFLGQGRKQTVRDKLPITNFEERERLHVDIGSFCNNNCIFCMEEDRGARAFRVGSIGPDEIRSILESKKVRGPSCDACAFSRVCDGVWRNYIDRFGWDEFKPVKKE